MTVTDFLQNQVPFLQGLSADQAHALAEQAEQQQFSMGQTVLFKGTTVDGLYVVASGRVTVWIKPDKVKPPVQVAELGVGDVFGETSIIEMGTAGATIKAGEEGTLVFVLPHDAFRGILDANEALRARASALIEARKKKNVELSGRPLAGFGPTPMPAAA